MKSVLVNSYGEPKNVLTIGTSKEPELDKNSGNVKIKVYYSGINYGSDALQILGQYQVKPKTPFIPGCEISGVVVEIGSKVNKFKVGDSVFALVTSGWADYCIIHQDTLIFKVPKGMSLEEASSLPICYGTAHLGLCVKANLKKDEYLLVHGGSGGVGIAAIQIGKSIGAKVIATASTPEKLEICSQNGADFVINYQKEDFVKRVKEITNGKGVNVVFDPVGGKTFENTLKCIAWSCRLLVVGFASGGVPNISTNLLLIKNADVIGLYWGSYMQNNPKVLFKGMNDLIEMYQKGNIKPFISKVYPMEQVIQAVSELLERKSTGKVVLKINELSKL